MDDFLFGSPTATEHDKLLRAWCAYSELESLYFERAKCTLSAKTVVVLGRKVGYREWGPDTEKLGQLAVKRPENKAELRSLLGAVNWVRRHLRDVHATFVLTGLLRKNKPWNWSETEDAAWLK